jgi:hypothetical protein
MARVKLVVFVPVTHAERVRLALAEAGAGSIGRYSHCSFSIRGSGRFRPEEGAHPFIGSTGVIETVEEERVEVTVEEAVLPAVIAAMKRAHPYEEVAFDLYPLL